MKKEQSRYKNVAAFFIINSEIKKLFLHLQSYAIIVLTTGYKKYQKINITILLSSDYINTM